MKKIIKKLSLFVLAIFNILSTKVYADMSVEASEASSKFYNGHKLLIESTRTVSKIMYYSLMYFIIIIPIIIIYKIIKHKNKKDSYVIKTLCLAELLCIINTIITKMVLIVYGHEVSKVQLFFEIFIISISSLNIGIIIFKLLKKNKVSQNIDTNQ